MGRTQRWQTPGLFLAFLLLYAIGACRTIYVGDSGELVAAVHTLGIPHPSGYPLYVLLGKLWTLVAPIGTVALRMSLFSAVFAAAAATGLFRLGTRLGLNHWASLFSATLLALSPSFWSQANIQRVYSLNAFFLVAALILATRWWQERQDRWLVAAVLVAALGASNHTYMGVFVLVLAAWALVVDRNLVRRWMTLASCLAAGVFGLSPYLYQPLRSRADPRLDWGDPETLDRWLAVVLRREAWERAWIESPRDLLVIGVDFLRSIGEELWWIGAVLALIGLLAMRARRWPALLLVLAMLGNFVAMALHGSRSDLFIWHRYYVPTYVVVALLAGLGVEVLMRRWPRWLPAAMILPLVMVVVRYPRFDRSRYEIAEDFSRSLLSEVPPGAHLSATDDNILFVLIYLHLVEGLRPDIDLVLQGVGQADLPPLRFDPATDPLYFTHHPNWEVPGLAVVPRGLTFKIERAGRIPDLAEIDKWELEGESDPRVPKDYLTQNLIGHFHYMLGLTLEHQDWLRAESEFEKARAAASNNDVLFYNLGLIYRRNGLFDRSLAAFERSYAVNPRHIASRQEVRASERIEEAKAELERITGLEAEVAASDRVRGLAPGSAPFHQAVAAELLARGEALAARGYQLRVLEATR